MNRKHEVSLLLMRMLKKNHEVKILLLEMLNSNHGVSLIILLLFWLVYNEGRLILNKNTLLP